MKKAYLLLFVLILFGILTVSSVSALPLTINKVWVDGTEVQETSTTKIRALDRDDEVEVRVEIEIDSNLTSELEDVQIEAVIRGYDHRDLIEDITDAFDAQPGVTYVKRLRLRLPIRMDQDRYKLRIRVEDRDGDTSQETYELEVESDRHAIWIKDVIFSPADVVMAGRALLTTVRIKNVGNEDEDDGIRIHVSIPELGLSATDYIDELDEDESTTSEELYMRIPACVREGEYDVLVAATYHDGDETETVTRMLYIVKGDVCPIEGPAVTPTTMISIGATQQNVVAGGADVIYPITITNQEGAAKTYTITVDSGDWATFRISPTNVLLLGDGETNSVYVYVTAKKTAPVGDNLFVVNVKKGTELVKQVSLKATVTGAEGPTEEVTGWDKVKKGLEVAVIVLIVILVIIGLIIGFRKLKGEEKTEDEKGESYY